MQTALKGSTSARRLLLGVVPFRRHRLFVSLLSSLFWPCRFVLCSIVRRFRFRCPPIAQRFLPQVVEGSPEFERLLPQTVALLARGLVDPHERVRHAALHCLACVSAEFRHAFQAAYHGEFLAPGRLGLFGSAGPAAGGEGASTRGGISYSPLENADWA